MPKPLSSTSPADETDVLGMKSALSRLGAYEAPSGRMDPWPDTPMFEGMKRVQKRHGLTVDGVAKPGGPTETVLRADLARAEAGTNPARAMAEETAREPNAGPAQDPNSIDAIVARTKKKQDAWTARRPARQAPPAAVRPPLNLRGGVGLHQPNAAADVLGLKQALSLTGHYRADARRRADPTPEPDLNVALTAFQRDFNLILDGVSLPGGETERRLNEIAGPLATNAAQTRRQDSEEGESEDSPSCAELRAELARLNRKYERVKNALDRLEKLLQQAQQRLKDAEARWAEIKNGLDESARNGLDACIRTSPKAIIGCVLGAGGLKAVIMIDALRDVERAKIAVETRRENMMDVAADVSELVIQIMEIEDALQTCS
jgi:hypothetical protein